MKTIKNLLIFLSPILVLLLIWGGSLLHNYILTVKYSDVMDSMVLSNEKDFKEPSYERIISYSEDEIITYCVLEFDESTILHSAIGGTVTYTRKSDGRWSCSTFLAGVLWSTHGTADDVIWPYWHHPQLYYRIVSN